MRSYPVRNPARTAQAVSRRSPRLTARIVPLALLALQALCLAGCVTLPRARFNPAEQAAATPVGFEHVRWNGDDPALAESLARSFHPGPDGVLNALAISGGGANGAYGAGLLTEWTRKGPRPQFQLVTGVSTGALTAPFAFLGPDWDDKLAKAYLGAQVQGLLRPRGPLILLTPGIYSKRPLERLVASYVTNELVAAVAAEHAKGRRLLVASTDLDTEELVVWDLGAIAAHGGPQARKLFAEVLVASASIPLVFPPSLIKVRSGAKTFTELHVDGQTESAFFAVPQSLLYGPGPAPTKATFQVRIYVIVNGRLEVNFAVTPRATLPIVSRTLDAGNKAAILSAILNTSQFCKANGCELFVSDLPTGVKDRGLDFSRAHIEALFDAGKAEIDAGKAWRTRRDPAPKGP
jgi:predicted acylesterase/phospholipase RssA